MRQALTVAVAQPACHPGRVAVNARAHAEAMLAADARLVVFPELSLTGYELDADPVAADGDELAPVIEACAASGAVALAGAPILEDGRRHIAALRIDASGAAVAYRKSHLGGGELERFEPGDGPTAITLDGWRIGLGICKDTGVSAHTDATAELGVDLYVAGLVHLPEELTEQDRRGQCIAAVCRSHVAFASAAGDVGRGYERTVGRSTIWGPDGSIVARAGSEPGEVARATLG